MNIQNYARVSEVWPGFLEWVMKSIAYLHHEST
jgi:hypothetical protein